MTATLEELIHARNVLKAWADDEIICEGCIPKDERMSGCLSCDTLTFFEAVDSSIEEMKQNAST